MAISQQTFTDIGTGVSDIFSGIGDFEKEQGSALEAQSYREAAVLAGENAQYTAMSTAIKVGQANRELLRSEGATTNALAGAGFATNSGSGLDILRQSAQEGATTSAAINYQGNITRAGYLEQQQSYELMASAADKAASADRIAGYGSFAGAALNGIAALATL